MLTRAGLFTHERNRDIEQALLQLPKGDAVALLHPQPKVGTPSVRIQQCLERAFGIHRRFM